MRVTLLLAAVLLVARGATAEEAGSSSRGSSPGAEKPAGGQVIVRFEGGDVNRSLAQTLGVLEDLKLLPKQPYAIETKAGPWEAIVAQTGLPPAYPPEMQRLLLRLNPKLARANWKKLGANTSVLFVRREAIQKIAIRRHFSSDSQQAQQRRDTITKNWKEFVTDQTKTTVDLYGYELAVTVEEEAVGRKAVGLILKAAKGNTYPRYRPDAAPEVGHYYADLTPDDYWKDPDHQKSGSNDQALMGALVSMSKVYPPCIQKPCTGNDCPDVMLVDSAVYPHWDLTNAIAPDSELKKAPPADGTSIEKTDKDVEGLQHGTYMLGIIAARSDNNAGLIGVHPGALVTTYSWDDYRDNAPDFVQRMNDREIATPNRLRVYIFASSWNVAESVPELANGQDTDDETLRAQHTLARQIMGDTQVGGGSPALWVVAAGQSDKIFNPTLRLGKNIIPKRFTLGPMNLGDYPNVIVVTACDKCDPTDLVLEEKVNYSDYKYGGVHVVARGTGIVSTAPSVDGAKADPPRAEPRYARGNGTSPATALAAGVVSAMASCYPTEFKEPWRVKERLQATSTPVFGGPGRDRFSSGIVHAPMALRDPTVSYLEDKNGGARAVELLNWCVDKLEFLGSGAGAGRGLGTIATRTLLRLKRRSPGTNEWISYTRPGPSDGEWHRGDIVVHGPARIKDLTPTGGGNLLKFRELDVAHGGTWSTDGPAPAQVLGIEEILDLLPAPGSLRPSGPCS
jgi:hypothetical protein